MSRSLIRVVYILLLLVVCCVGIYYRKFRSLSEYLSRPVAQYYEFHRNFSTVWLPFTLR